MNIMKKIVGGSVAALTVAALAPAALAQCSPARSFASHEIGTGKQGYNQVRLDMASGVHNGGQQIGTIWQSSNYALSNNGTGGCPAANWFTLNMAGDQAGIAAFIDGGACLLSGCPGPSLEESLSVVIEEWGAGGPPGVGENAYFHAWQTAGTPTDPQRYYNFANAFADNATIPYSPFPQAFVNSSARNGSNVDLSIGYADVAPNATAIGSGQGMTLPASTIINSWDLVMHVGMSDPGRDRGAWTTMAKIPYVDGAGAADATVSCPDTVQDVFVAVGISFDGGAAGDVESNLVGIATRIECDPAIADPTGNVNFAPVQKRRQTRPARGR